MSKIFDLNKVVLPKEEPDFYPGDSLHKAKRKKVQEAMKKYGLEALLLFKDPAVRYVTDFYTKGFRPWNEIEYAAVVPKNHESVLCYSSGSDTFRVKMRNIVEDYRKLPEKNEWHNFFRKIFSDYGIKRGKIGVDILPYEVYLNLKKILPDIEFEDISKMWMDLTCVKLPEEIGLIKEACEIVEIGLNAAMEALKPGITEIELAAAGEYAMRKENSEFLPMLTDIASGYNSCIFSRVASPKRIRHGEMVIADFGAVYKGYTAEFCRTFFCGKNPSKEQKRVFQVCYKAHMKTIEAIKPGITCEELDAIPRRIIEEEGLGLYQSKWASGHQIGFALHGEPLISKGVKVSLVPNMVINIEPRVTMYDRFDVGGSMQEDCLLVTENGHELLSKFGYNEEIFLVRNIEK